MKNNRNKVMDAIRSVGTQARGYGIGLKNKVVDKTSDLLSVPVRSHYDSKSSASDAEYKDYKMANDMRKVPDKGNESDPLFRIRASMRLKQMDALKAKAK